MTSSHRGIIRGVDTDGVVFCDPSGGLVTREAHERSEKDHLQALEEFWLSKGRQEGRQAGFEEGFQQGHSAGLQEGEQTGSQKGLTEGEALGLEKGLEEGRQEAELQVTEGLALIEKVRGELGIRQEEIIEATRYEIIEFCMAVCRQILRNELSQPDVLKSTVEGLLGQAAGIIKQGQVTVTLSPDDRGLLALHFEEIQTRFPDGIDWVSDPNIVKGDVRVETSSGLVNFSVDRQLQELGQQVLETGEDNDADTAEGNRDSSELASDED
jgi:flagellar assembly protein FliH